MNEPDETVNNGRKTTKFAPGNPGRPRGSRNRRSRLVEALMSEDLESITRSVIAAAKTGDMVAARLVLDRLSPVRRGTAVTFKAPRTSDAASLAETFANIIAAMAAGELSPDEAASIGSVLEQQRRVIETVELEERLRMVEAQLAAGPRRVA